MKIPFKFLPQLFNTLYFTDQSAINSDVAPPPSADAGSASVDSSTTTETSTAQTGQPSSDVIADDGSATAGTQVADPLAGIPTLEEAQKLMEQNVPNAEAVVRLRTALNERDELYKPLETWKPLAEKNLDPSLLSDAYEMVTGLHSRVIDPVTQQEVPDRFTTRPFLEKLETDSPGTTDQLFSDLLTFQVQGPNGPETMVRNLVRSWGLDPDRIEDYRNIDARVPSSGFVTPDQLVGIDPELHDAFKALSQVQREDILAMKDQGTNTYPPAALEYLNDKAEALEARKFREQFAQQQETAKQEAQAKFEQETQEAVTKDISTVVETMHDSIQKRLSSQWQPSSDEVQSEIEYAKVMGSLFSLLDPGLRKATTKALERAGVPLDPKFDGLVAALEAERTAVVRHARYGDRLQAGQAQSRANLAQNQLLAMLENYAMALAQPSANRLQANAQNLVASLNGATARHVPTNGNTSLNSGPRNPYDENPHPLGTQEYKAWNQRLDRQLVSATN